MIARTCCLCAAAFVTFVASSAAASDTQGPSAPTARGERGSSERREADRPPEHFRIGPIVGVGFPRPLALEAFGKVERLIGLGLEYSFLPTITVLGADVRFKAAAADLRVFPFRGAFFIGARVGRQWLDASRSISVARYGSFTETMEAATWFVNPRIGFLHTFDSGVTVGIDAGVQLPIQPTYERAGPATELGLGNPNNINQTLASVAGALGNNVTPTIDLLRLGFLF